MLMTNLLKSLTKLKLPSFEPVNFRATQESIFIICGNSANRQNDSNIGLVLILTSMAAPDKLPFY